MQAFRLAVTEADPEWVFCFDADERPSLDLTGIDFKDLTGIRLRLFDFYITPHDIDLPWHQRQWIGPEYRDILMFFRADRVRRFPDREPSVEFANRILYRGDVKHYGKAISVEDWEKKCDYYGNHLPEPYRTKWLLRKGRAVKDNMKSDFGIKLIKWDERKEGGIVLTPEIHAREWAQFGK